MIVIVLELVLVLVLFWIYTEGHGRPVLWRFSQVS
jgi:hypothetical protein